MLNHIANKKNNKAHELSSMGFGLQAHIDLKCEQMKRKR